MKALFITYNGALEPLIKSQGIPYLKGLSAEGIECFLLSFEKPLKDRALFEDKISKLKEELNASAIKWYHLRYHKRPSVCATLFDIKIGMFFTLWLVISKRIDIIHARATVPAVMGFIAAKLTGRKFIFDERGLMAEEYADGGMWKRGGFLYRIIRRIEKALLLSADSVVVLTENIKDFLQNTDYLSKKTTARRQDITVIPCCVDTDKFNRQIRISNDLRARYNLSDKFIFLYTGSLGTWYMLEEMIDFFITAKSEVDNAHFVVLTHLDKDIVRDAWAMKELVFDDITIDGAEFEMVPDYIRMSDVGLFFIKPLLSKRSSCPIKFAEYLACGLPVVINSGIGDTDKIVEERHLGVVIRDFNRKSYLEGINKLLELMKEKNSVTERCINAAEDLFSLEMGVSRYHDLYNKVLNT